MCVKHCARGFKSAIYRDAASLAANYREDCREDGVADGFALVTQ